MFEPWVLKLWLKTNCVWWGFGWECAVDLEFEFHLAKHPKIWAVLEWHMLYMSLVASNV
jgi:hypothetical protein